MSSNFISVDPRYPTGRLKAPESISDEERDGYIGIIAAAPARMRDAVKGLSAEQLDTPYRDGGWTVRQVVHHVPDSHMNSYVRFKLALTETDPVIKPYDEAAWAKLKDIDAIPIETSLCLLDCLHQRWVSLMRVMSPTDWQKRYIHPEFDRSQTVLDKVVAMYAWHCGHHIAHITELRKRRGW